LTNEELLANAGFVADCNGDTGKKAIGEKYGIHPSRVQRLRKRLLAAAEGMPLAVASAGKDLLSGKAEENAEGGSFTDVQTLEPITDWTEVFTRFRLDPASFTIADDTVRMSTWQQSKALENGERDVVNLYSYSARFVRIRAADIDVAAIVKSLRSWKPAAATHKPIGAPVTMFLGWADWQIGKGEGDKTEGTKQRILDSFEASEKRIRQLRKQGVNIEGILFANMGDHTEAVTGHYTSQTYSVDLNQRDQLNLAIELNLTGIKALAPLVEKATYAACLCNHGQWQRLAGKQITDDADNSTGFIADILKTVCDLHPALEHLEWIIPRDEMITTGTFSGVNVAMAHGHKISGNEDAWLAKQSMWLQNTRDFKPELWATAHRHTAINQDFGLYHRVQCATNDPGSKSFTDGTGKFSTQGTSTFLIGTSTKRRITHYEVL